MISHLKTLLYHCFTGKLQFTQQQVYKEDVYCNSREYRQCFDMLMEMSLPAWFFWLKNQDWNQRENAQQSIKFDNFLLSRILCSPQAIPREEISSERMMDNKMELETEIHLGDRKWISSYQVSLSFIKLEEFSSIYMQRYALTVCCESYKAAKSKP